MTPDPAQVDVAELRALLEAARPGPWYTTPSGSVMSQATKTPVETGSFGRYKANADLIAAARNALPALLDEVEDLRAMKARVEALADEWGELRWRSPDPADAELRACIMDLRAALESKP